MKYEIYTIFFFVCAFQYRMNGDFILFDHTNTAASLFIACASVYQHAQSKVLS